ncbi:PREDICTED: matrix-remodeling-associated protein 5-like [Branchiostoma belcheri]|uniref:Matrix-remodeling-associated protein 5-like n=1 Tax=Branchiostoma belcheri TaxID=7741 RepID=A0A6P4ZH79_BRABE|nr:PREDICTED: matrix-remodeling-associated protein 5-like [Branchiostoma belcheri]
MEEKTAGSWRIKMGVGWWLAMSCLCLVVTPSCVSGRDQSGGYRLDPGLTLTQGYYANNTYIVNITHDDVSQEHDGSLSWQRYDKIRLEACVVRTGCRSAVGTFTELTSSSLTTCQKLSRTGESTLKGEGCIVSLPLTVTWKAPKEDVGRIKFVAMISPKEIRKFKSFEVTSETVDPLPLSEKNKIPPQLMNDHAYFVTVPVNQSVALGEPATFHCEATANTAITITWTFHDYRDIPLPYNSRHRLDVVTRDLTILSVEEGDLGRYTCQVNNKHQQHAWLNKYVKPRITHYVPDMNIRKRESAMLECQAVGKPPPTFTWLFKGKDVQRLESGYKVFDNGTLKVHAIQDRYDGAFTCVAQNLLGEDRTDIHLEVLYPPEMDQDIPETRTVLTGGEVRLECKARGNPPPEYAWSAPNNSAMMSDSGQMYIPAVQLSDAGQYRCEAGNGLGKDETTVELVVHDSSSKEMVTKQVSFTGKASI